MSKQPIGTDACPSTPISAQLEPITLNSVRGLLTNQIILQACDQAGYTFRNRILTPVITVLHMVLAAIWPEESFAASWHVVWDSAVSHLPRLRGSSPSSGSLSKARARLPLELWKGIFDAIADRAQCLSESFALWRGHRLVLTDGTCLSMPDTRKLHAAFGTSTSRTGKGKYPLARLVTLALAQTRTILSYNLGRYDEDENTLLQPLLASLRKGDLLIADRHFVGANLYARYLAAGLEFLTRAHPRLKVARLKRLFSYAENDFVTDLPVSAAHRGKDPQLPKTVRVRLIQATVRIRGQRQVVWFVTSLLDPAGYPAGEVVELYARRWRIETLLREIKIGLGADVLRSQSPPGVRKEVAARLVALNVVRTIILEAAIEHDVVPLEISFVHALRAILVFSPAMATSPVWKLPEIYDAMLAEIAANRVEVRPNRLEPRAVRREPQHYPTLKITRDEWKLSHAA